MQGAGDGRPPVPQPLAGLYWEKWKCGAEARGYLASNQLMRVVEAGLVRLVQERPRDPVRWLGQFLRENNPASTSLKMTVKLRSGPLQLVHRSAPQLVTNASFRAVPNWRRAGDFPIWGMSVVGLDGWKRVFDHLKKECGITRRLLVVDVDENDTVFVRHPPLPKDVDPRRHPLYTWLPFVDAERDSEWAGGTSAPEAEQPQSTEPLRSEGASRCDSGLRLSQVVAQALPAQKGETRSAGDLRDVLTEVMRSRESRRFDLEVVRIPLALPMVSGHTTPSPVSCDRFAHALQRYRSDLSAALPQTAVIIVSSTGKGDVTTGMALATSVVSAYARVRSAVLQKKEWKERMRVRDVQRRSAIAEIEADLRRGEERDRYLQALGEQMCEYLAARSVVESADDRRKRLEAAEHRQARRAAQRAEWEAYLSGAASAASTKIAAVFRGHKERKRSKRRRQKKQQVAAEAAGAAQGLKPAPPPAVVTRPLEEMRLYRDLGCYKVVWRFVREIKAQFEGSELFSFRETAQPQRAITRQVLVPRSRQTPMVYDPAAGGRPPPGGDADAPSGDGDGLSSSDDELFSLREEKETEIYIGEDFAINPLVEVQQLIDSCSHLGNFRHQLYSVRQMHQGVHGVQHRALRGVEKLLSLVTLYCWLVLRSIEEIQMTDKAAARLFGVEVAISAQQQGVQNSPEMPTVQLTVTDEVQARAAAKHSETAADASRRLVSCFCPRTFAAWMHTEHRWLDFVLSNQHLMMCYTEPPLAPPQPAGTADVMRDRLFFKADVIRTEGEAQWRLHRCGSRRRSFGGADVLVSGRSSPGGPSLQEPLMTPGHQPEIAPPNNFDRTRKSEGGGAPHRGFRRAHRKLPLFLVTDPLAPEDVNDVLLHLSSDVRRVVWLSLAPYPTAYVGPLALRAPLLPMSCVMNRTRPAEMAVANRIIPNPGFTLPVSPGGSPREEPMPKPKRRVSRGITHIPPAAGRAPSLQSQQQQAARASAGEIQSIPPAPVLSPPPEERMIFGVDMAALEARLSGELKEAIVASKGNVTYHTIGEAGRPCQQQRAVLAPRPEEVEELPRERQRGSLTQKSSRSSVVTALTKQTTLNRVTSSAGDDGLGGIQALRTKTSSRKLSKRKLERGALAAGDVASDSSRRMSVRSQQTSASRMHSRVAAPPAAPTLPTSPDQVVHTPADRIASILAATFASPGDAAPKQAQEQPQQSGLDSPTQHVQDALQRAPAAQSVTMDYVRAPVVLGMSRDLARRLTGLAAAAEAAVRASTSETASVAIVVAHGAEPGGRGGAMLLAVTTVAYALWSHAVHGIDPIRDIARAHKEEQAALEARRKRSEAKLAHLLAEQQGALLSPSARSVALGAPVDDEDEEEELEDDATDTTASESDESTFALTVTQRLRTDAAIWDGSPGRWEETEQEIYTPGRGVSPIACVDQLATSPLGQQIGMPAAIRYMDMVSEHCNKHLDDTLVGSVVAAMAAAGDTEQSTSARRRATLDAVQALETYATVLLFFCWLTEHVRGRAECGFDEWLYDNNTDALEWIYRLDPWPEGVTDTPFPDHLKWTALEQRWRTATAVSQIS
eukprot:TRINITY_DN7358_c0_g1_i1.p1 TRINITY_DN7358_c0_g1~~TRINITY_DN7358_c0_g1_i1.p1  ORF type:complete len:1574 (+),score=463.92 TRINITY_DN7358_c0_g1_i1:59-4780(+)